MRFQIPRWIRTMNPWKVVLYAVWAVLMLYALAIWIGELSRSF